MNRRAPVFRWLSDATTSQLHAVQVGELTQSASRWEFCYDANYLALGTQAWELDPALIRTKQRSPYIVTGSAPPAVFRDVALSGWSLETLKSHRHELLGERADAGVVWGWWEQLIYAPADGFGALFVGELAHKPPAEAVLAKALGDISPEQLLQAALQSSSGAMGGERPKIAALWRAPGREPRQAPAPALSPPAAMPVLLKFSLPSERADSVVAEATSLSLGLLLGLQVPRHHIELLNGMPALCIERFDRAAGPQGCVQHCVSAGTALGLPYGYDREGALRSYVMLRSKLKEPGDALELYKRVLLNAAVGNSDDHPGNTSLRQIGLGRWALSPLYDVMPFFIRSRPIVFSMAICRAGRAATRANLVAAGRELAGLPPAAAEAMIDDTIALVRQNWRRIFHAHAAKLPGADIEAWAAVFEPSAYEL